MMVIIMADQDRKYIEKRSPGRRVEDWMVRDQIHRHKMICELGQMITSEMHLDALFDLIIEQINQFMSTERCSVFIHDPENEQLWSLVSTDLGKDQIRFKTSHGVAGWVFRNKSPVIINDPYSDPRFFQDIDKKTGFRTRNILCIPLINREQTCIGTLQTLNQKDRDFTEQDLELLTSASHYVAIALENAKLYEDLKVLDKAKERVINHLSHELRTPLAIIHGVLHKVRKCIKKDNYTGLEKSLKRGERSVNRLLDLQTKIDDILNQKSVEEKKRIIKIIEDAVSFIEELSENSRNQNVKALKEVSNRLESIYSADKISKEKIPLDEFLDDLCNQAESASEKRNLEIVRNFEKELVLEMDRNILFKVCGGILKNAIENTPDEGIIEINARFVNGEICIDFKDYGIGITSQNQQLIFGGFFHTQDTNLYSSKKPYEFNAGGSGSDLLRTKVFSERYGFSVDFNSTRCKHAPTDAEMCAGKISECQSIREKSECYSCSGSVFSIRFPATKGGQKTSFTTAKE